ncbi:MAG: hypothetical protein ACR2L9_00650 [Solirubrobacteraceae bacterium]
MRRQAQSLISLALLAVSFSAAANAGAAARTELAPEACPGNGPVCCQPVAGTPKVVPCCEPTILPCTGSLTIVAAPDPSKPRHAVKITGQLVTFAAAAGATITLWQELAGKTAFRQLAQTTTDATGHYSFTRPAGSVQTGRSWYTSSASARSATVSQRVWDAIILAVRATKGGTGEMVTFTGKVFPSHAGQRIRLERRAGKAWVLIARVRLTVRSSFRLAEQFAGASSASVRAVMAGDGRNIKSYSATVKTTL